MNVKLQVVLNLLIRVRSWSMNAEIARTEHGRSYLNMISQLATLRTLLIHFLLK